MPPRRTTRSVSGTVAVAETASAPTRARPTRAPRGKASVPSPGEREEEGTALADQGAFEPLAPVSKVKIGGKPRGVGRVASANAEDEENVAPEREVLGVAKGNEDEEEDLVPARSKVVKGKGKQGTTGARNSVSEPAGLGERGPAGGRGKRSSAVAVKEEDDDDEEVIPSNLSVASASPKKPLSGGSAESVAESRDDSPSSSSRAGHTVDEEAEGELEEEEEVGNDTLRASRASRNTSFASARSDQTSTPVVEMDPEVSAGKEEEQGVLGVRPSSRSQIVPVPASSQKQMGPVKRLVIHKMVLINFKSYAGRQEIGPFHKSFSAIVGPNGSGKSNTIDAMLFVFGYRASKMRQGKLSELIHNSAGLENLDFCAVEVWFREIVDLPGPDAFQLVPDSQIVITRTAYRNNSSKYAINDRTSSFTEVTTLLKAKGIDLDHKRFLILQGEVESIAQMKPKAPSEHEDGLLEYLEDIIGTSRYKEPIEEAQVQVDKYNEERGEKMNRLRLVEKDKSSLEAKKREAEDFLRDTNELTRKKSLLWQFHMYTLRNNLAITAVETDKLTSALTHEQEKNAGNLAEIDSLQQGYVEQLAAFEEVKKFSDELNKTAKKMEKEEVGLTEKKKHLVGKRKKLEKSIKDASDGHARSEALTTVESRGEELSKTRKKLVELEGKVVKEESELERIRDSLKDKTYDFTNEIEAKQLELQPWTAKISEAQAAVDLARSEKGVLENKAAGAQKALDAAITAYEELDSSIKEKRKEQETCKAEKKATETQLQIADGKLKTVIPKVEALRSKVASARHKSDEARSSMAANKSENAVLGTLSKLRDQGRIKGFHGRLGDLGTIDDKYDVAITTACGSLNHLVVDTVEQGQACIEVLRKGNVGRASILVLEKLPARDTGPIATPENAPRLIDLIKPKEPRFAAAFFKAVNNTLVADNMEQAQRIAYGQRRWRVVTLGGEVIDISGTMAGGGGRPQRGGMSSKLAAEKVRPEVIAKYEQDTEEVEKELALIQAERRTLEAEVQASRDRLPEIEMNLEKLELDLHTSGARIAASKKRVEDLKSQNQPDPADRKRIVELGGNIVKGEKAVADLKKKSGVLEERIKVLQGKILEVGGVELRAMQSKVTTTKGLIDNANDSITHAEVAMAKSERDADKHSKAIAGNTATLTDVDAELEGVQTELEHSTTTLNEIRTSVRAAEDGLEEAQEGLAAAKKELDEKSASINAFRAKEMDLKQKLDDYARGNKEFKSKLKHWTSRHEELELAQIDEDEDDEDEGGEDGRAKTPKPDPLILPEHTDDELASMGKDEIPILNAEISQLEEELGKAKPNLNVLAEYRKREAEFLERGRDLEQITALREEAKGRYDELRKTRLEQFMTGFTAISSKLKEMYQMITLGGNAELELVDSMDPFSEGIIFSVMPPKKSWRNISNLSGGEKTLSSLALVFALHVFKPTPLYFMDEIDAALDFRNVSIIANYIKSKTEAAQFIIISLRNDMFELSHRLVGIYKTSNCTKSIAIDNKDLRTQALIKPRQIPATPSQPRAMAMSSVEA